jgi:putative hydrolase of the HAD superfamily
MIKAIVFDFGGVILQHRIDLIPFILKQLFPQSLEEANRAWNEHKIALNKGTISSKDMLLQIKKETNATKDVEELLQMWGDIYEREAKDVNFALLELIDKLRKQYKVYLFTDTIDVHDAINRNKRIDERFSAVYKSFEEGISKLEGKKAFYYLLKKINLKPEECVYIDDLDFNIESAKQVGIKTILYRNNNQLKLELKKLGVKKF